MPILRTPMPVESPGHFGEVAAFRQLSGLPIDDLELWFNLQLPRTPEIDLILNHPAVGAYIIEVKAFYLHEIESYTPDNLVRADGKTSQHPVKQVRQADFDIRRYLGRYVGNIRVPFFQKSVLWPRITRQEWLARFNNPVVRDHADFMLFSDDLENPGTLLRALQQVTDNPLGIAIPPAVRCDQPGMAVLRRLTNYDEPANSIPLEEFAEPDVLTAQEKTDLRGASFKSQERIKKYPAKEEHLVAFRGFPGSGKTTALRDLAVAHAEAGNSVLYVSFNKILAAKVRQEINEMLKSRGVNDGLVTVSDQYQLLADAFPGINNSPGAKSKWLEQATKIAKEIDLVNFDTLLLDESQDSDGEFLDVLELLKSEHASVFFAFGDKQQLYNLDRYPNGRSPQLALMIEQAEDSQFNRVFRNGTTSQLICAAVADKYPNIESGIAWLKEKSQRTSVPTPNEVLSLEFEDFYYEPHIVVVDRDPEASEKSTLNNLVQSLLDSSRNSLGEVNGLVIVGGNGSSNYRAIKAYMDVLEIPYADLVSGRNRREVPAKDELIITTFNSARGLTSQHTLVLDCGYIESSHTTSAQPKPQNLFNIALSRASETTVVYSGVAANDEHRPALCNFIEMGLQALQR